MEVADAESFLDPRRSRSAARPGLRCCRGLGRGGAEPYAAELGEAV